MFCFPLTTWTTMRGGTAVTSITQSESQWLDLQRFQDIVAWLECKNVTLSGATNITIAYQTAPTKDDSLFANVATAINLTAGTVTVTKGLMSSATVANARWLRWQLAPSGGVVTASWDATFRLWIAANLGLNLQAGLPSPPLRPNGKSCNGDCQKGGSTPIAGSKPSLTRVQGRTPTMAGGSAGVISSPGAMVPNQAHMRRMIGTPPQHLKNLTYAMPSPPR